MQMIILITIIIMMIIIIIIIVIITNMILFLPYSFGRALLKKGRLIIEQWKISFSNFPGCCMLPTEADLADRWTALSGFNIPPLA